MYTLFNKIATVRNLTPKERKERKEKKKEKKKEEKRKKKFNSSWPNFNFSMAKELWLKPAREYCGSKTINPR